MARLAIEAGVDRMAAVGELPPLPGHHAPAVHSVMAGRTGSRLHWLPQVHRRKSRVGPAGLGCLSRQSHGSPEQLIGKGDVVGPLSHPDQLQVLFGGLQE